MRTAKELLIASKEFAGERRWLSWWHLGSTLTAFVSLIALAVRGLPWGISAVCSMLAGLVGVRIFIIYHDYQHHAILRHSPISAWIMTLYGLVTLNPPSVWNRSHDHHHKNNSKAYGASIGSYPIMTTQDYAEASRMERVLYAVARHPLTMVFGYLTVFLWGMSLRPFVNNPRRHWDAGLAIVLHFGLMAYVTTCGYSILIWGMLVPSFVASALGAYLFYAQHNFPAAKLQPRAEWSHVEAALHSSSYINMSWLMHWFTGNIGFHHVHHLNARIPFYRLPDAMTAIPELQSPGTTSLLPHDMAACLRLKLWSPEANRFVGFKGR